MKQLTPKEEEIMELYWEYGPMQVRELQSHYDEPRPHVNTLATLVKIMEEKGFLAHKALNQRCFQYYACMTREEYKGGTLKSVIDKFFGRSYMNAVSALVKEEKISVDELKQLIEQIEKGTED